jgi:alkanesulfonate monooxygenase SsuD/methylene tetrahydromethanopterin reductase-like flavin-dependent oxidoreductase (luciferase family)
MPTLEFGIDTFVPVTVDGSGLPIGGDQVIRNTVEEAVLAEAVGIDSFNIGEHYRAEFMDSAGHVILAAIASRTERIRLGTAVTVLSTQDPVRLYTDFATLDAVSNGRAQLIVGRGSLTDSFPLFGFDLADYEELYEEKVDLLVRLLREQPAGPRFAVSLVRVEVEVVLGTVRERERKNTAEYQAAAQGKQAVARPAVRIRVCRTMSFPAR